MIRHLLFVSIIAGLLSSCQTNMIKQFGRIQNGMDKHDVLELMGAPKTSLRMHGKDRWIYVFHEDNIRFEKEVHFQDGKATYVGDTWQPDPAKKAEVVDTKNDELNKTFEEEAKKHKSDPAGAKAYVDYEREIRGENKVNYMPDFVPVR